MSKMGNATAKNWKAGYTWKQIKHDKGRYKILGGNRVRYKNDHQFIIGEGQGIRDKDSIDCSRSTNHGSMVNIQSDDPGKLELD